MNVLFVGGSMDGEIQSVPPETDSTIRIRVGDQVEFYSLETDKEDTIARHRRGVATFYRTGPSADSLIDFEKEEIP